MMRKSYSLAKTLSFALVFLGASALLAFPYRADAAVTLVATTSNIVSASFSYTVPSGSNRLLIVTVTSSGGCGSNPASAAPVTYNAVTLTLLVSHINSTNPATCNNSARIEYFYLVNPPTGAHTLAITDPLAGYTIIQVESFTGVNQKTPFRGYSSNEDQSSTGSVTIASAIGDLVLDTACNGTSVTSAGAGQTLINLDNANGSNACGNAGQSVSAGAPSVTTNWTFGGFDVWVDLAASIEAAPPAVSLSRPPNNLGLVGYWSFDDATGTKATDLSGNGNTGTLTNIANPATASSGWTASTRGGALNLDGTNDYVNAGNSSLFNFTSGSFTISFWVKAGNQGHDIDFVGRRTGTTQGWAIETNGNLPEFCSNTTCVDATKAYNDNTWHLITLSRSGTSLSFYRDGVLDVARTIPNMSSVSTNLTFGVSLDVSLYLNGTLDEMRIYNRSLSAGEIQKLYQSSFVKLNTSSVELQKGTTLANGLVGHWTFDGNDVSDKVYDRSGNNNNGYFVGGATTSAKVPGKLGQALKLSGNSEDVDVATESNFDFDRTNAFSISLWVKVSSAGQNSMIGKWAGTPGYGLYTAQNGDSIGSQICAGNCLVFGMHDGGTTFMQLLANSAFSLGTWRHVVVTYDGSSSVSGMKVYLDGALATTVSTDATSISGSTLNNDHFIIGALGDGVSFFPGILDDVRVYNRALTAAEVKQLYNLGIVTIKH